METAQDFMNRANEAFGHSEPKQGAGGQSNNGVLDVGAYLDHYGIGYKVKANGGRTDYALDHCVFDSSHVNNDAAIFQDADGKLGHKCFHDSCHGKGWKDVRQAISGDESLRQFMPGYEPGQGGDDPKVEAWPEPEPIKAEMLPVEELREEMIPDALWPMIQDVSYRMAVPPDYVAIPLIIVIGSVIGTGCRIKPKRKDDWSIVPNLWGGISGPPSRLKTPAMDEVISKTLGRLETESGEENKGALAEWQKGQRAAKMTKAVLESEYKTALKDERKGIIQ